MDAATPMVLDPIQAEYHLCKLQLRDVDQHQIGGGSLIELEVLWILRTEEGVELKCSLPLFSEIFRVERGGYRTRCVW